MVPDRPFFRWVQQTSYSTDCAACCGLPLWKDKSMNVYDVGRFFFRLGQRLGFNPRGGLSFRLFVAFFPAMILLLSIIPYPWRRKKSCSASSSFSPSRPSNSLNRPFPTSSANGKDAPVRRCCAVAVLRFEQCECHPARVWTGAHSAGPQQNWMVFRLLSIGLLLVLSVLLVLAVFMIGFCGRCADWAEASGWLEGINIPLVTGPGGRCPSG